MQLEILFGVLINYHLKIIETSSPAHSRTKPGVGHADAAGGGPARRGPRITAHPAGHVCIVPQGFSLGMVWLTRVRIAALEIKLIPRSNSRAHPPTHTH